jgi:hypothetical protein
MMVLDYSDLIYKNKNVMIKTELKTKQNGQPIVIQRINIKCDDCDNEWESCLYSQIKGIKNYGRDLCRGCKQKEQIKLGQRRKQYVNAGNGARIKMKGKTYVELYGIEKASILSQNQSDKMKGDKNSNYGGTWHSINPGISQKGKTFDEIYGIEKAMLIKQKISKKSSGENNPMYGKPSPQGSGNGWSGWYKGWFFRSLKELSYMVYVIERFKLTWNTAEIKKYSIDYIDWNGTKRTYHPDFIIENKYLVEIKPKTLLNSDTIKRKKYYAIEFCIKNNLKYKLRGFERLLSNNEIDNLINEGKLEFLDKYKNKYEIWKKEKRC